MQKGVVLETHAGNWLNIDSSSISKFVQTSHKPLNISCAIYCQLLPYAIHHKTNQTANSLRNNTQRISLQPGHVCTLNLIRSILGASVKGLEAMSSPYGSPFVTSSTSACIMPPSPSQQVAMYRLNQRFPYTWLLVWTSIQIYGGATANVGLGVHEAWELEWF